MLLAIHFTAMPHFYHENKQPIVFDGIDDAIVSNPNAVELITPAKFFRSMRTRCCGKRVDSCFQPLLNL